MSVLFLLIVGAAAGFLATRALDMNTSVPVTIAIGVLGALIGGFVVRFLLTTMALAGGFIGALLGAFVLIWIWQTYIK